MLGNFLHWIMKVIIKKVETDLNIICLLCRLFSYKPTDPETINISAVLKSRILIGLFQK